MIDKDNLSKARSMYAVKANDLITKSRFSFSLEQQKILLYMISKITPLDFTSDWYEIEVQDYCEICGLAPNGQYYENIKAGLKEIANQSCWIEVSKGKMELFRWLDRVQINKHSGKISYKFHETIFPYLFDLKDKFTKIELIQTLTFRSRYTLRLYEYLKAVSFHAYPDGGFTPYSFEVNIADLKKTLDCEQYGRFQDFRRFVLEVAEDEINNKTTDMRIEISFLKKGRQFDRVVFKYLDIWQQDEASVTSEKKPILNGEEHRNKKRAE